jgi:DNA topoisomerase-1
MAVLEMSVTNKQPDLVIVESPAKARTISRILGNRYRVLASLGHVRDLPEKKLGIDVEHEFAPSYQLVQGKKKVIEDIREAAKDAPSLFLATDPDREGEAIAWHVIQTAQIDKDKPVHRVVFHEITPDAIGDAFKHPRQVNQDLVNAQQARRTLDRLVGYKLSPFLWKKIQGGLSAGRVQSVALRMIVDREAEIKAFVTREYWVINAMLRRQDDVSSVNVFRATLLGYASGKKIDVPNHDTAVTLASDLESAAYVTRKVNSRDVQRAPAPPFITSTLQQEAVRKLRFSAQRTMAIAQQLYEGINLGDEGSVGLITYMRTDSTHIAPSALAETRDYILEFYGEKNLPPTARVFSRKGKFTQEAHEAIRPTNIHRTPAQMVKFLDPGQAKLYELIWKRMVASQMVSAVFRQTTIDIIAHPKVGSHDYLLRAASSQVMAPGFLTVYEEGRDDSESEEKTGRLPDLTAEQALSLVKLETEQRFTQPPPRFTEATLIKTLEQNGIGRPSTYATILGTIQKRDYVHKEQGKFVADDLGTIVTGVLAQNFPKIVDVAFTASLEEELDNIARGETSYVPVMQRFWGPFQALIEKASRDQDKIDANEVTDIPCPKCGRMLKIKRGRFGKFYACSGYPECRHTQPIEAEKEMAPVNEACPKCGKPMRVKRGRFGLFLACSSYPECKGTLPLVKKTGLICPKCGKELVERANKKGKNKGRSFIGCSNYPECKFILKGEPLTSKCPDCGGLLVSQGEEDARCIKCEWKGPRSDSKEEVEK